MKILIFVFIALISECGLSQTSSSLNILENQENTTYKEISELLEFRFWKKNGIDEKNNMLYSFDFNNFSKRKGKFIASDFINNDRIHISELDFKIKKNDQGRVYLMFSKGTERWFSEITFLSKIEIVIDGIEYNYVRIG